MPDLLNYLEMRETGEIYENRLKKNIPLTQREEKDVEISQGDKVLNNLQG